MGYKNENYFNTSIGDLEYEVKQGKGSKIFSLADRKEVAKRMEQENKSELKNNY